MMPVVAIVAPGNMGAAVARRLNEHGVQILTTLSGRSFGSETRAASAGMHAVPLESLADADFVLSILPPSAALSFAEQMGPALANAARKPVFVDCNAVSPATVHRIGAVISATNTPFVDAGIIGSPPAPGKPGPRFYASGESAPRFAALGEYGIDVHVLDGPIGAASALKLSFAGINKGLVAVGTAMILAATRSGADKALLAELAAHWPTLHAPLQRQIPGMLPKAYRWVGEMQEIAAFVGDDSAVKDIFLGAARLFERISSDVQEDGPETTALLEFFANEHRR